MAVLTQRKILEEIEKGRIKIEGVKLEQIGPGSVDLHLGDLFRVFKRQNRLFKVTNRANYKEISEVVEIPRRDYLLLKPGEAVIGIIKEKITLPPDICGWIEGRSRFARIGISIHITSGFIQPGTSNRSALEIMNLGTAPVALYPGTKICQVIFERCEGKARYKGKFKDQEKP